MYKLSVTDSAEEDLDRIIEYITKKLSTPKAASSLLDEIYDCYDRIEQNPYIYEECHDSKLKREGYRRAVINNYIVVYRILEDKKEVIVHGLFYGRQDYATLI